MTTNRSILITGATGLLGGDTLARLLAERPDLTAYALVRDPARLPGHLRTSRVVPVRGDLTLPGLGLERHVVRRLRNDVGAILHFGADTRFSQTREEATSVNVEGTRRMLELAASLGDPRFVHASTAFAVGRRTGVVRPGDGAVGGWVNEYERSKLEAEGLVRGSGLRHVILRPSTIVYDAAVDAVTQVNAVHRALRVFHGGLAAMLPGDPATLVDLITADYAATACAALALHPDVEGRTLHVCAGEGSMSLEDLLDAAHDHWARDVSWRSRRIERPALTDLATWRLMERSIEETGSSILVRVTRSLAHFAPQLAFPKRFETAATDRLLGFTAPPVRSFWGRMLSRMDDRRKAVAA